MRRCVPRVPAPGGAALMPAGYRRQGGGRPRWLRGAVDLAGKPTPVRQACAPASRRERDRAG
nr:hypothetical protein RVX_3128 [Nitratidesulfovibrio sp. HK-II]